MFRLISALFSLTLVLTLSFPAEARGTVHHPQIVVLDPGHGGWDTGGVDPDGTLAEKTVTLQVAERAARYLRAVGYRVYLTRTRDTAVNTPPRDLNGDGKIDHVDELDARNLFANRHHASIFVSIHFDSSTDSSVHGTHGYYCPNRPFWRQNERLAGLLTNAVVSALDQAGYSDPNGGIGTDVADKVPQTRADYPWFLVLGPSLHRFVTGTAMPGALIETLYLSNPGDANAARKPKLLNAMARGYADGIEAYFRGEAAHR